MANPIPPFKGNPTQLAQITAATPTPAQPTSTQTKDVSTVTQSPRLDPNWTNFETLLWAHTGEPATQKASQLAIYASIDKLTNAVDQEAANCLIRAMFFGTDGARQYLNSGTKLIKPGSLWHARLSKLLERLDDPALPENKISPDAAALAKFAQLDPANDRRSKFPELDFLKRRNLELSLEQFSRTQVNKGIKQQEAFKLGFRTHEGFKSETLIADINHRLFNLGSPRALFFKAPYNATPSGEVEATVKDIFFRDMTYYEKPGLNLFDFDPTISKTKSASLFIDADGKGFPAIAGVTIGLHQPLTVIERQANRARIEEYWKYKTPGRSTPMAFDDPRFMLSDLVGHLTEQMRGVCNNQMDHFAQYFRDFTVDHENHHHAQMHDLSPAVTIAFAVNGENSLVSAAPLAQVFELMSNLVFLPTALKDPDEKHRNGIALTRLIFDAGSWGGTLNGPGHLLPNAKNLAGLILLKNARLEKNQIQLNLEACRPNLHAVERVLQKFLIQHEENVIWPHVARHCESQGYIAKTNSDAARTAAAKTFVQEQIKAITAETKEPESHVARDLWATIFLSMRFNGESTAMENEGMKDIPALHRDLAQAIGLPSRNRNELVASALQTLLQNLRK